MRKFINIFICVILSCGIVGCSSMNSQPGNLTIYFVRHGQTDTNVQGLMVGQSGSPALTETGKDNAHKLGEGLSNIRFDAAYSSELERAYDTAGLVLEGAGQDLKVEKKSDLNDISWGDAEGMTWAEISEKYGVTDMSQCFGDIGDKDFKSPMNAENKYDFCKRFGQGVDSVISENKAGDTVLIVAHSSLAFYLRKLFPKESISGVDNTSVTIVEYSYDMGEFKLKDLNDTSYIRSN